MRRLYLHVYLTVVGSLLLFSLLAGTAWLLVADTVQDRRVLDGVGAVAAELLPPPAASAADQQAALERLGARFPVELTLYGAGGGRLAVVGAALPPPEPGRSAPGWVRNRGSGPTWAVALPDGRWLMVHYLRSTQGRAFGALLMLALLALAVAVAAYPVVRRITRRLERLQRRVDALGAGDLGARVKVEGRDEVAALARSFNRAAERIERLVGAHKVLLANASHELRSPLARIRMALELPGGGDPAALRARVAGDIGELDALIDEILLASRLDVPDRQRHVEAVDLLGLLAEECARVDADLEGEPVTVAGDGRLLRRLVRNLLENARRHGGGTPVEAFLARGAADGAELRVCDRGPGVPEVERERIFEPFYRPAGRREGQGGGVGLGLALVRQIARRHGGDVVCLPRDGGGTCFCVTLAAEPG